MAAQVGGSSLVPIHLLLLKPTWRWLRRQLNRNNCGESALLKMTSRRGVTRVRWQAPTAHDVALSVVYMCRVFEYMCCVHAVHNTERVPDGRSVTLERLKCHTARKSDTTVTLVQSVPHANVRLIWRAKLASVAMPWDTAISLASLATEA